MQVNEVIYNKLDNSISINGQVVAKREQWLMVNGRAVVRWFATNETKFYQAVEDAIIDLGGKAKGAKLANVIKEQVTTMATT